MTDSTKGNETNETICKMRIYECLGCGFIGSEQEAEEHQIKCDNPMEMIY